MKPKQDWESWVTEALKGRHLKRPSAGTLRQALALGSQLPEPAPSGVSWLVQLLFDSSAQPLPVGVRSSVAPSQRRLLFQAETGSGAACQLDLRVRREVSGTLEVTGQILPSWGAGRIEAKLGRTKRTKKLGNAGEFVFRNLPGRSPSLQLEIHGDRGDSIVIPEIPLLPKKDDKKGTD